MKEGAGMTDEKSKRSKREMCERAESDTRIRIDGKLYGRPYGMKKPKGK